MTYYVESRRTYGRILFCIMQDNPEPRTIARCDVRADAYRIADLLNAAPNAAPAAATVARKGAKS